MERVTLCKPCAIALEDDISFAKHLKGQKITCARCGRRRFGDAYDTYDAARIEMSSVVVEDKLGKYLRCEE